MVGEDAGKPGEPVAQAVEHLPFKQRVAGSSPARLTMLTLCLRNAVGARPLPRLTPSLPSEGVPARLKQLPAHLVRLCPFPGAFARPPAPAGRVHGSSPCLFSGADVFLPSRALSYHARKMRPTNGLLPELMPDARGMKAIASEFTETKGREAVCGRRVSNLEMARWLGLHVGTLRNRRSLDRRDGQRRGRLIYRKFGGSVRYWLSEELLNSRFTLAAEGAEGSLE